MFLALYGSRQRAAGEKESETSPWTYGRQAALPLAETLDLARGGVGNTVDHFSLSDSVTSEEAERHRSEQQREDSGFEYLLCSVLRDVGDSIHPVKTQAPQL